MAYIPQFEKEYENGWVDFPSEETLVTAHALDMYDGTFEHIEEYLEDNPFIQTATMPTASEDELGHIYQYMGETTATFTQGYFYKCVSDEEEDPTYSWQNISVQSGGGGGSDVSITPTLLTGTKIADFEIDGVSGELYAPTGGGGGTNAQWTQTQTNGTKIAEITIDNVSQDVFDSTWSGTHAEYELVKNDLPNGTKIFFTDDGRVTSLWTGDQTTTGNITLSEGYANFDEIEVVWRANRNAKAYTRYIRINVSDIDTTILYQFADSWFSNPNTYCLFSFHFSASTTVSVDDVQSTSEYAPVHILAIRGIKY